MPLPNNQLTFPAVDSLSTVIYIDPFMPRLPL